MAVIGRIARAHGIRGQVIVNIDTDFPSERFEPGAELMLKREVRDAEPEPITITTMRLHQGRPVIGIDGIGDMNAAMALVGAEIRIPREQLMPLPAGMFYWHDLIGCRVDTESGMTVGTVTRVERTTGHSHLVVDAASSEVLIPLVAAICTTVDPRHKRIVIDPPDGLLDVNEGLGSQKIRAKSQH